MIIIPDNWLKRLVTVDEVEKLTHLDMVKAVVPFEFMDKDVVDKGTWFKEPVLKGTARWDQFKVQLEDGDELWYWEAPNMIGMKGYAIKRGDAIATTLNV